MSVCMYVCMYKCKTHECMNVCMYTCVYACMDLCIYKLKLTVSVGQGTLPPIDITKRTDVN